MKPYAKLRNSKCEQRCKLLAVKAVKSVPSIVILEFSHCNLEKTCDISR